MLGEAGADGFGVGTYVSSAPTIDFALDIVSIEDRPVAKRGKLGGKKQVWRCQQCIIDIVQTTLALSPRGPECGSEMQEMLKPLVKNGKIVGDLPSPQKLRERVLDQINRINK